MTEFLKKQNEQINTIIKKADIILQKNFHKNISLSTISSQLHINRSYLSRLYKKEKGITITEAITKKRIEEAKKLLLKTDFKVYEIANDVGIEDPAYFSQLFKKYTGYSPKDFKYTLQKNW